MDINKHIEYFDSVASPSKEYTKKIQAGRLKGMTDIKPQWRILALTQRYGLCGFGWKYEIVDKTIVDGADGSQVGFVDINLFVKIDEEWSAAIPGTGGSSFIANERNGKHTSDEVFKMALTDAISVAAKAIGVASDIYLGLEPSKYDTIKPKPEPEPNPVKPKPVEKQEKPLLTPAHAKWANAIKAINEGKTTLAEVKEKCAISSDHLQLLENEINKGV